MESCWKTENGILYRRCYNCGEWYPATHEYFTINMHNKHSISGLCRKCKAEQDKEYHAKIKADPVKWAAELKRSNERKKANPNTQVGWTEYNNRPEVKERKKQWAAKHKKVAMLSKEEYTQKMWHNTKQRAKQANIPFDIEVSDIIIPEICPLLEIPLFWGKTDGRKSDNSPSLDKLIPEKGYVKGNVRVISSLANVMKNKATVEQLQKFASNIMKYMNGEDIVQTTENNESVELQDKEPVR